MTPPPVSQCETIHGLLLASDDDGLTAHERAQIDNHIDSHLATCSACRRDEALRARASAAFAAMPVPRPDAARRQALRQAVAERQRSWLPRFGDWLRTPVPAYSAVAAALVVFALAGVPGDRRDSPADLTLAAVADSSLPSPVLTQADSYNVMANIRLLDRTLQAVPLLTDSLDRALLPGTQL